MIEGYVNSAPNTRRRRPTLLLDPQAGPARPRFLAHLDDPAVLLSLTEPVRHSVALAVAPATRRAPTPSALETRRNRLRSVFAGAFCARR